ncbi:MULTISPECIES: peptidoglycan-binding domain-containing protein [unclassified Streptomyces]|uniref:peptidoglycan-binding domain-containing protein n=1 Tax=unclassified Streptomyces TaxID=2593676 RepID=UPI000DAE973F|nr:MULTISPECIES: peptidoglycan-binding domain-containing protein [unclassified Streptomyces]PZT74894.1 peptidoglycan-binding protein [Streptomyces sp. AC1-42T]PZT82122.1 peptidoglycan-binding protein [Streptomyces sp. AC1-42W]
MTGHICPECGTEGRPGTGPGCACAGRAVYGATGAPGHLTDPERAAEQRRIAEEHHAGRSAEMAAAEDFDPLRIRPYVTLGGDTAAAPSPTTPPGAPHVYAPEADAATTMPLYLPPMAPAPHAGDGTDEPTTALLLTRPDPVAPRRRKPFAAVVAGAAVVTVVGTAAFIGGLFNGDGGGEADLDQALPSTVASLPDESVEPSPSASASASPSPSRSASPSASATASASASASASSSVSPSRSASASASASGAGHASSSPSATAGSSAPVEGVAPPPTTPDEGETLRRGDYGPAVAELQNRLREVWVYNGPVDSSYGDRTEQAVGDLQNWWNITGDPKGVYGPHTRTRLEAVTTGRGRR